MRAARGNASSGRRTLATQRRKTLLRGVCCSTDGVYYHDPDLRSDPDTARALNGFSTAHIASPSFASVAQNHEREARGSVQQHDCYDGILLDPTITRRADNAPSIHHPDANAAVRSVAVEPKTRHAPAAR